MPYETMPQEGFCNDLIYEILRKVGHVSLETLSRCRAVCREWKRITDDPRFMELVYPGWCQNIVGYYYQGKYVSTGGQTPDMSLGFMSRGCRLKASDKGIMLCSMKKVAFQDWPAHYFVCKPSTKEWVKIPNPKGQYRIHVMAIHVIRARPYYVHFKILCASQQSTNELEYEIFDSKVWKWKPVAMEDNKRRFVLSLLTHPDPVMVGGKANWVEGNNWFMFDMHSETLSVVPLCIESDREMASRWRPRLLDHEGKLGFLLPTKERDEAYLFVVEGKDPITITHQPMWRKSNSYDLRRARMGMADWSLNNSVLSLHILSMTGRYDYMVKVFSLCSDFLPCNLKDLANQEDLIEDRDQAE